MFKKADLQGNTFGFTIIAHGSSTFHITTRVTTRMAVNSTVTAIVLIGSMSGLRMRS